MQTVLTCYEVLSNNQTARMAQGKWSDHRTGRMEQTSYWTVYQQNVCPWMWQSFTGLYITKWCTSVILPLCRL